MGKKKDKKRKDEYLRNMESVIDGRSKKQLNKEFNRMLKEIEASQYYIYETDKLSKKDSRKKINKKEYDFYTGMDSLKARKKLAKKWENDGILDRIFIMFRNVMPLVKTMAKLVMVFIVSFLSIDGVQKAVSPGILDKLMKIFHIAMAV